MDEENINAAEFEEIPAETIKTEELPEEVPFQQPEINTEAPGPIKISFMDRFLEYASIIVSWAILVSITALTLTAALTFIPAFSFTGLNFLRCWCGLFTIVSFKGLLKMQF